MHNLFKCLFLSLIVFPFAFAQLNQETSFYQDGSTKVQNGKVMIKYNAEKIQKVNSRTSVTYKIKFNSAEIADMVIFTPTDIVDISQGTWSDDHRELTLNINTGVYDMIFGSFSHVNWIVKENININSADSINVDFSTEPVNIMQLSGKDENGTPLASYPEDVYSSVVIFPPANSPFSHIAVVNVYNSTTYGFNTFSSRFTAFLEEYQPDIWAQNKIWVVQYPLLHGVNSSQSLVNNPAEYKSQIVKVNNITTDYCYVTFTHDFIEKTNTLCPTGFSMTWMKKDSLITNYQFNVFLTPDVSDSVSFSSKSGWFESNGLYPMSPGYFGQVVKINDNKLSTYFTNTPTPDLYKAPSGGTMHLGIGPAYPFQFGFNNYLGTSNIASSPRFCGGLKEYRITDNNRATYNIFNSSDVVVSTGELGGFGNLDVPAGIYRFVIKNNTYKVLDLPGEAIITETFDLTKADATPPRLTSFRLENASGIYTDKLNKSETGKLVFASGDYFVDPDPDHLGYTPILNDSTKVWYKLSTSSTWLPLTVTNVAEESRVGYVYNVTIPSSITNINSGEIDIKLQTVDPSFNKTEVIFKPAFAVRFDNTPVELTSFSAQQDKNFVVLNWATSSETNNRGFEVEKYDGAKWNKVSFVTGSGTTTDKHNYSFREELNGGQVVLRYRLKQMDFDGAYKYSKEIEFKSNIPVSYSIEQNFPNPFNPTTMIRFSVPVDASVKIKLYNMLGEETAVLLNGQRPAGTHELLFNAANYSSGIYLYSIEATGKDNTFFKSVKKMTLVK